MMSMKKKRWNCGISFFLFLCVKVLQKSNFEKGLKGGISIEKRRSLNRDKGVD